MKRVRVYDPVEIARQYKFVRETLGPNRGVFVEAFQRIGDGRPGDSWCMDFLSWVLWVAYQGPAPLPRTGSCDVAWAIAKQYDVSTPAPGDVFFRVRPNNDAHHVGLITSSAPLRAIAGNTSEDGKSSNGTGVFETPLAVNVETRFIRLPLEIP